MALTQQQINDLTSGSGIFSGYVPISGDLYQTEEQRNAWQSASPRGVQSYNGTLYGIRPANLGDYLPNGDNTIDASKGADTTIQGVESNIYDQLENYTKTTASNIDAMYAQLLQQYQSEAKQNIIGEQKNLEDYKAKFEEALNKDIYKDYLKEMERLGVSQKLNDVKSIKQEMNDLMLEYRNERNRLRKKPILASVGKMIENDLYEKYYEQNTMLNNRLSLLNDDLNLATKQLDKFYNAVSERRRDMISNYKALMDMANKKIINLKNEEKTYVLEAIKKLQERVEREEKQKQDKIKLFENAWNAGIDPYKLGVKLTDDIETMIQKLSPVFKQQYDILQSYKRSKGGNGVSGRQSIPKDLSPIEAIAYGDAMSLVGFEPNTGFSQEAWKQKIEDLKNKVAHDLGQTLTDEEASNILARMMTRRKNDIGMKQLQKQENTSDTQSEIEDLPYYSSDILKMPPVLNFTIGNQSSTKPIIF